MLRVYSGNLIRIRTGLMNANKARFEVRYFVMIFSWECLCDRGHGHGQHSFRHVDTFAVKYVLC